jgi:hypothetical protein
VKQIVTMRFAAKQYRKGMNRLFFPENRENISPEKGIVNNKASFWTPKREEMRGSETRPTRRTPHARKAGPGRQLRPAPPPPR